MPPWFMNRILSFPTQHSCRCWRYNGADNLTPVKLSHCFWLVRKASPETVGPYMRQFAYQPYEAILWNWNRCFYKWRNYSIVQRVTWESTWKSSCFESAWHAWNIHGTLWALSSMVAVSSVSMKFARLGTLCCTKADLLLSHIFLL